MKFKFRTNSEEKKRRQIAAQALAEIRKLSNAKYPLAMPFDKLQAPGVERVPGEGWPQAYGRKLGLDLQQLRDFTAGLIETGMYQSNVDAPPTAKDLLNYFRGWSALLIEVERELQASHKGGD